MPTEHGDLYEVMTDTWGSTPPVYPKGHILSAKTVAPGRDLEWAVRVGAVKLLADDDPRRKYGPSEEPPQNVQALGDDGWSHPDFPYRAPVTRSESEAAAQGERAMSAGAAADAAGTALDAAAEEAKIAAEAASATKKRAEAMAKASEKAAKVAEKEGEEREPSSADIAGATSEPRAATTPTSTPSPSTPAPRPASAPPVSGHTA